MRRVGIDVGGTNTDAVLLEDDRVVHAVKTPTTPDVTSGITRALRSLLADVAARRAARGAESIDAVMIGTTHFTNAVVQRRDLSRVAAVRIGLPASASLEPFDDWPEDLAAAVRGEVFMLAGGHEYDGRPLVPLDEAGVRRAARRIREAGLPAVAVASVFSPLNAACEERAAAILREECPDVAVYDDAARFEDLHPKYGEVPPRLAVEVLSPDDRATHVMRKIADYLRTGVQMDLDEAVSAHSNWKRELRVYVAKGAMTSGRCSCRPVAPPT